MTQQKHINLPWNQSERYWVGVQAAGGAMLPDVQKLLARAGLDERDGGAYFVKAFPKNWGELWLGIDKVLQAENLTGKVDIAVIPGGTEPDATQIAVAAKPATRIREIAGGLWLGEALIEQRLMCFLQPVISGRDTVFGYEAFARVQGADGKITGGAAIVAASKALGIEFAIDRQLHVEAVKTFVSAQQSGFLFINFFPGFIQRPEVYLEGLSETVREHGIISRNLVLDFTHSELPHDIHHLKRVTDYCRGKGYAIALDDMSSLANTKMLLSEVRPDYIKLDMQLIKQLEEGRAERETTRAIVELCKEAGTTVIAEGVETEAVYALLKDMGVDLFQGYLFSPPVAAGDLPKPGEPVRAKR